MTGPVLLYDTTLRDGTQREGLVLSLADKLKIARRLDEAGFPYIEGGWPGSNPKDEEFFAAARSMTFRTGRLAAFGSTRHRSNRAEDDPNLRALLAAETPVITIVGKTWLLHVTEVVRTTLDENLAMIGEPSVACGRPVARSSTTPSTSSTATRPMRPTRSRRCAPPTRWRPHAGAVRDQRRRPDRRGRASDRAASGQRAAACTLGIHAHDDTGCGVANSLAAVLGGARHVQGTINGFGERCGNANLSIIVPEPGAEARLPRA